MFDKLMSKFKHEYKSFLDDIEKNIKNLDDLNYIKERFAKFMDVVIEKMDQVLDFKNQELDHLLEMQKGLENRMDKMQRIIDNIEKDIYSDEGFDFEIICPYCNYEFIADVDENKTEIECPECKNMIELDWSGDTEDDMDSCSGNCSGCSGCDEEDPEQDDDDDM